MIGFFFSHALPKVTAHIMPDLPIFHVTDEDPSPENHILYRVVETLQAAIPDGRWAMVRKVSDLMRVQPEFLVMRNAYGSNLMYLLWTNPFTPTTVVDIFFEGPSSIRGMFYEKDDIGRSVIAYIARDLALYLVYEVEKSKEVFDAIVEKVREDGKHDVADSLLQIWRENFFPPRTRRG